MSTIKQQMWNAHCRCKGCTGHGLGWITHVQPKNRQASNQEMKRTHNIDGLSVDPVTGEVMGSYTTHDYDPAPYVYPMPTQGDKPFETIAHLRHELDPTPRPEVAEVVVDLLPDGVIDLDAERSRRGPKPKVTPNQIASLLHVAHSERRGWVDDYVFGACATAAGVSSGKLNVSPSNVLRACLLDEISVEVVTRVIKLDGLITMDERTARRICQCTRFAISAMERYLECNPTVRQQLQGEVNFANSYYQAEALVVTPTVYDYPAWITALREAGDYLAYGEALRGFRGVEADLNYGRIRERSERLLKRSFE